MEAIIEDAKLDLKNIPWMFLPDKKKSLVQLFHTVHSSIDTVFATPMVGHKIMTLYLFWNFWQCVFTMENSRHDVRSTYCIYVTTPLCRHLYNSRLLIPSLLNWALLGMNVAKNNKWILYLMIVHCFSCDSMPTSHLTQWLRPFT